MAHRATGLAYPAIDFCGAQAESASAILSAAGYRLIDAVSGGPVFDTTNNYLALPPAVSEADLSEVLTERSRILATRGPQWVGLTPAVGVCCPSVQPRSRTRGTVP